MAGTLVLLSILGAGFVLIAWTSNENMPNRNGAGEWRSAPRPLWRLLRRGPGPPLIGAMAMEALGITWISLGVLGLAGVRHDVGPLFYYGSVLLFGVTFILVELRGRLRD